MFRNHYNDYPVLTEEQFAEVLSTDLGIREAHFSHGYELCNGITGKVFFSPCHCHNVHVWGSKNEYKITTNQQAKADALFLEKKEKALLSANTVGTLTFVSMGGDYNTEVEGGIGNHRIRATFEGKNHHKWFVEVSPLWKQKSDPDDSEGFSGSWVDITYEEEEEKRFLRETKALIDKYGGEKKVPMIAWSRERKWPNQRHGNIGDCYAEHKVSGNKPTHGRKFTETDLRVWINRTFKCNYKKLVVERYFLSPDDYVSKCA